YRWQVVIVDDGSTDGTQNVARELTDAQCGFKTVSRRAVEAIVPHIEDQSWFFDTELLVLAEKQGYRIKDIPIVWIEDDDSRVKIVRTAWDDIKGVMRLFWQLRRQSLAISAEPETTHNSRVQQSDTCSPGPFSETLKYN